MKDEFSVLVLTDMETFNQKVLGLTIRANRFGSEEDSLICIYKECPYPNAHYKYDNLEPDNEFVKSIANRALSLIHKSKISSNALIEYIIFVNPNRPVGNKIKEKYPSDDKDFIRIFKSIDDIGYFLIDIIQDNVSYIII